MSKTRRHPALPPDDLGVTGSSVASTINTSSSASSYSDNGYKSKKSFHGGCTDTVFVAVLS